MTYIVFNKVSIGLLAFVLAISGVSCTHKSEQKTDEYTTTQDVALAPGTYIADEPENIAEFFETLCCEHGAVVAVHNNDINDSMKVWNAVRLLDDYAAGRRTYYPADEVRQALEILVFELGHYFSHGDGEEGYNRIAIFFNRFLEQAVRLSPKVDYVTDFHCADGTAGILNYHEWSYNPLYSLLIYPTNNGLRVRTIGELGTTKIKKLFHLTDNNGRDYYLCSNNGTYDDSDWFHNLEFCQFLYLRDGNEMEEVASCIGLNFTPNDREGKIVFNPQQLRWNFCRRNGDVYVPIEGSKSLQLHLDGKKSRFVTQ